MIVRIAPSLYTEKNQNRYIKNKYSVSIASSNGKNKYIYWFVPFDEAIEPECMRLCLGGRVKGSLNVEGFWY